ncbi:hypothetical protein KAR50_03610 [Periweissella fabaria]|uniref:Regulatory protein YycH domain-containing protein n=1 Tax=Periweissella fabaria TaxID=546157 RepID=A0ABN8BG22_9LACO|nr:two-component system activity regulator YycH [Periweissella fabaria]MCM0596929.1 hypothetical protein [Periweissella fabaria]CAH0416667.1 hypothetical protein WFA24289_00975 [Periweissella fabaria]
MPNKDARVVKKFGVFSQYILPTSLVLVIIISLTFTWLIWTNPAHFNKNANENTTSAGPAQLSARALTDIYSPSQIIHTDGNQNQKLLFDQKINVINEVIKDMKVWHFDKVKPIKKVTAKEYGETLNQEDAVILNYPDSIAGGLLNDIFNQQLTINGNVEFNRILVPLGEQLDKIYLLNDANFAIYEIDINAGNTNAIMQTIKQVKTAIPVAEQLYHQHVLLNYPNEISLKQYSYLQNKQSQHLFLNALFNNGSNGNFKTRKTTAATSYEEGNNRRVSFDNKTGAVDYQSFSGTKGGTSLNNALRQGFNDLLSIGVPLDNTRYFETNNANDSFVYRTYVEGFPIFNQTRYGTVRLSYENPGTEHAMFSQYSLQVPLPNNQAAVKLESSPEVIQKLATVGVGVSKIEDMQIGYEWQTDPSSDMVVNLRPVWYIEISNKWKRLDQWVQKD